MSTKPKALSVKSHAALGTINMLSQSTDDDSEYVDLILTYGDCRKITETMRKLELVCNNYLKLEEDKSIDHYGLFSNLAAEVLDLLNGE